MPCDGYTSSEMPSKFVHCQIYPFVLFRALEQKCVESVSRQLSAVLFHGLVVAKKGVQGIDVFKKRFSGGIVEIGVKDESVFRKALQRHI